MKQEIIFSMDSPFRDTFRIKGYRFGKGEKSLAIVGSMRGDEVQQLYLCSQIVKRLEYLESRNALKPGCEILVIPSVNPFSMNIEKRFWAMDNTDINRMFPGYDLGETTQRIADALFKAIQGYRYGIQMASSYIGGEYMAHVRMLRTGYEDIEKAELFGMPYVCLRDPIPFDTTLLNYNWQIWETKAFSIYGGSNNVIDDKLCHHIVRSIFNFMQRTDLINRDTHSQPDYRSVVFNESELITVKAPMAGIFYNQLHAGDEVFEGESLAQIIHPYEGTVIANIQAPASGLLFFVHNKPLALQGTPLFRICST